MCLAIAKPAGAVVPVGHLYAGYQGNPHGCGFAYAENGKLSIVKGLFSFKEFMERYRRYEHLPMLVHFRYSTHGEPSVLNCHPFSMWEGRYALIHNGVIHIHQSISKDLSDTAHFARLIMEPMLKAGINPEKAAFRYLVEESIGDNNKVLIMDNNGKITIYNESLGEYEDAEDKAGNPVIVEGKDGEEQATVWYSNVGYKYTRRRGKQRTADDPYDGFFDCCRDEEVVPADFTTNLDTGFRGKAKLDPPPGAGVIQGFKAGVRNTADPLPEGVGEAPALKNAGAAAEAMAAAWGGTVVRTEKSEITPVSEDDLMITGPLFSYKVELEIAYMKQEFNMNRAEAIVALGLDVKDAESFVEA